MTFYRIKKITAVFIFSSVISLALSAQSKISASNSATELAVKSDITSLVAETSIGATSLRPTPQLAMSSDNYPVTAGDVYTLAFAVGTNPVTYTVSVDTTYKFRVANLAVLNVQGMTFVQLKKQVEDIVTKNYPLSGVQFVLVTPAVFQVTVNGEVVQTEIKQTWALTRLSSVIQGVKTPYSSERNIVITSANGKKKEYDLFKAQRFGDLSQDPYVRPDDVITLNRVGRLVSVSGAVERPGKYELKDGENLNKLFEYYGGGFTDYADKSRIEVVRYNPSELKSHVLYLNEKNLEKDFVLEDNDAVKIVSSSDLRPVMFMEGAVISSSIDDMDSVDAAEMAKIPVRFDTETNYATLLRSNEKRFQQTADLENAYIIRNGQVIPIDINKILYDRSFYSEEVVQPYDTLRIPFKLYFVTVSGAVRNPGRYPFIPDRSWEYYIGLAGGFDSSRNKREKIEITDINGNKLDKKSVLSPETTIKAVENSASYQLNQNFTPWLQIISTMVSTLALIFSLVM